MNMNNFINKYGFGRMAFVLVVLIVGAGLLRVSSQGGMCLNGLPIMGYSKECVSPLAYHIPPTAPSKITRNFENPLFPETGTPALFSMTSLTVSCVNNLPRVTGKWTAEPGTTQYLFQRKFPNNTIWETTGGSYTLTATDATWQPGYGPGVYSYRVQGKGVSQVMTVTIPSCAVAAPPPPPPPTTTPSFTMTSLLSTCVSGLPRVTGAWTTEAGTTQYIFQRQFPNSTVWESTGGSYGLTATDATWQPGYSPGIYSYRVQGKGTTLPMSVSITSCAAAVAPAPAPTPTFIMTSLVSSCVNGLPRVTGAWTAEPGTTRYSFQRQFPNSTVWESTGGSYGLTATDATWQPGYGPGVYSYRALGSGATPAMTVNIPQCGIAVAGTPPPAPTLALAPVPPPLPATRMAWGAYPGPSMLDLQNFETLIGKPTKLVASFFGWGDGFPSSYAPFIRDQGKTLVIFWEQNPVTLDQIIAGNSDAYIRSFAAAARLYGGPVLLSPLHEMNGSWTPWSGVLPGNSPAKVIAAWRHIHTVFGAAPNVRWVWAVNSNSVPDTAANAITNYYPGSAYVDDVGIDGFNFGAPWMSFDAIFRTPLNIVSQYGKPIYIMSTASAAGPSKAAWITDAFAVQLPKYPNVVGWIWFNQNKEQNWLVNSDPNSLAAFKAIIPI